VGVHLLPPLLPLRTVAGDWLVDAVDVLAHVVLLLGCNCMVGQKHFNFLSLHDSNVCFSN
jgi:hypothetical protein